MFPFAYLETSDFIHFLELASCDREEKRECLPLVEKIIEFATVARRDGAWKLDSVAEDVTPPLLKKGLQLVADGTAPALIGKILFYNALCNGERGKKLFAHLLVIEGVLAIQEGQNPRNVRETLLSLFGEVYYVQQEVTSQ